LQCLAEGLAPDPAKTREAVVQVYGARTMGVKGLFGVHTWVAVKPTDAPEWTIYEVIGWRLRWTDSAVVVRNRAPDHWFHAKGELYAEKRGEGVDELIARIRVALRHAARPASGAEAVFRAGELAIDFERRRVTRGGQEVRLTPTEYDLLKALVTHADKVVTHRMLLNLVWGGEAGTDAHYLHVYVGQLRRKIERDPSRPQHLLTEPGVGYRFRTG
jgi:hypothetical protein